jgi:hypothetical protein
MMRENEDIKVQDPEKEIALTLQFCREAESELQVIEQTINRKERKDPLYYFEL